MMIVSHLLRLTILNELNRKTTTVNGGGYIERHKHSKHKLSIFFKRSRVDTVILYECVLAYYTPPSSIRIGEKFIMSSE